MSKPLELISVCEYVVVEASKTYYTAQVHGPAARVAMVQLARASLQQPGFVLTPQIWRQILALVPKTDNVLMMRRTGTIPFETMIPDRNLVS